MKVIIVATGEVKNVSLGYAVNYLLPNQLAQPATAKKLAELTQIQTAAREQKEKSADANHQQAERLDGKVLEFKHETVTKKKIAAKLKILKTSIVLAKPIRKPGEYDAQLKFGQSRAKIKIKVV